MVLWLVVVGLLIGAGSTAQAQDAFELSVPGRPELSASATLLDEQLTIRDAAGASFVYLHEPRWDSSDGAYWGFYSREARQAIRWPVSGNGAMLLGGAAGDRWRLSQQRVRRVGGRPGGDRGTGQLDWLALAPRELAVARITPQGRIELYTGWNDAWRRREFDAHNRYVPGGAVVMANPRRGGRLPSLFTIDRTGRLVELSEGGGLRPAAGDLRFVPGGRLAIRRGPRGDELFAVDQRGRLWAFDVRGSRPVMLEADETVLSPGAAVAVTDAEFRTSPRPMPDVFVVDRHGSLVGYSSRAAGVLGPEIIAAGFTPGGPVAACRFDDVGFLQVRAAAVDWAGRMQCFVGAGADWAPEAVSEARFGSGAQLALGQSSLGPMLMGVDRSGQWLTWVLQRGGWSPQIISPGFPPAAPVVFDPLSMTAFALDPLGRLTVSWLGPAGWQTYLCDGTLDLAPRLVSRRIVPHPALPDATVTLENSTSEELVVQVVDALDSRQPVELKVPARGSIRHAFARDAGGILEEVYLAPGPLGTLIEQVHTHPIPPQPRYELIVWVNRVTYQYFDRRKTKTAGALPNFDMKSHVSQGVVPIPPGELLRDGERIDLAREAAAMRNPGAAVWFPPPQPDPQAVTSEPPLESP